MKNFEMQSKYMKKEYQNLFGKEERNTFVSGK